MKIYNYHPKYNYYTGDSFADESPLEPGVYHIPAYATSIPVPEYSENEIPVFDGAKWVISPIQISPQLTTEEKLQSIGLTVEELKMVLGL